MKICILNGPNLNLVGLREPEIYGAVRFEDYFSELQESFGPFNGAWGRLSSEILQLEHFQSNHEGALIDKLHELGYAPEEDRCDGLIVNFGALSHTSHALADALRSIPLRAIEVHISNIFAREGFRQNSVTAAACVGSISGLGLKGYELACKWWLG